MCPFAPFLPFAGLAAGFALVVSCAAAMGCWAGACVGCWATASAGAATNASVNSVRRIICVFLRSVLSRGPHWSAAVERPTDPPPRHTHQRGGVAPGRLASEPALGVGRAGGGRLGSPPRTSPTPPSRLLPPSTPPSPPR